jgi:hypothetical protein
MSQTAPLESTTRQYVDLRPDVKLVLTALWTAILFVFAYVDILGLYRADVLHAALHGKVASTSVTINQQFLVLTLGYVMVPALMVVLSLVLKARTSRFLNAVVSLGYLISVAATCIGEDHVYYLLGSAMEAVLLLAITYFAWRWPTTHPGADF